MSSIWVDLLGSQTVYRGKKYRTRVIEAEGGAPLIVIYDIGGHAEAYSRTLVRLGRVCRAMSIDLIRTVREAEVRSAHHPDVCEAVLDVMDSSGAKGASIVGESLGAGPPCGWLSTIRTEA